MDVDLLSLVDADDEHRGIHAQLLQHRRGVGEIAGVAVVHGDEHGLVRQGGAAIHEVDDLGDGDGLIARVPQGGHLLPEFIKAHNGPVGALLGKVVVHEHRQAADSAAPGHVPDVGQQQDHCRQQGQQGGQIFSGHRHTSPVGVESRGRLERTPGAQYNTSFYKCQPHGCPYTPCKSKAGVYSRRAEERSWQ